MQINSDYLFCYSIAPFITSASNSYVKTLRDAGWLEKHVPSPLLDSGPLL